MLISRKNEYGRFEIAIYLLEFELNVFLVPSFHILIWCICFCSRNHDFKIGLNFLNFG